jgi:hypothetical protein
VTYRGSEAITASCASSERIAPNAPLTLRATKEAIRRIALYRWIDAAAADDLPPRATAASNFTKAWKLLAKRAPRFTGQ